MFQDMLAMGSGGGGTEYKEEVISVPYNSVTASTIQVTEGTYIAIAYRGDTGTAFGVRDTVNNITNSNQMVLNVDNGYITILQTQSYSAISVHLCVIVPN